MNTRKRNREGDYDDDHRREKNSKQDRYAQPKINMMKVNGSEMKRMQWSHSLANFLWFYACATAKTE